MLYKLFSQVLKILYTIGGTPLNFWQFITQNKIIVVSTFAWAVSQSIKIIIILIKTKKFDLSRIVGSGGMPSSHAATVSALATSVAKMQGLASPLFAISFVFALVVMYDAAGVRLAVSKQAKLLNQMIYDWHSDAFDPDEKLKELIGHTPIQVFVGCLLGIMLGIIL